MDVKKQYFLLREIGADVNANNSEVLNNAAHNKHEIIVNLLIEAGIKVNVYNTEVLNSKRIVKLLNEVGALILNVTDKNHA